MVEVALRNGKTIFLQEKVKVNLDILLNDVKTADMDLVIVIDGGEGTGKSFMARGVAMYCATVLDSPFGIDDIYFDAQSYINGSLETGSFKKAGYHKINILDEGRHVLNRKRGMSSMNVNFTNYLSECRSLGQVHIILCPAMHDLDKNIIMWRMNLLLHNVKKYVSSKKSEVGLKMQRGTYYLYTSRNSIGYCYETFGYKYPNRWEARGQWCPVEVFSQVQMMEYDNKKDAATIQKYKTKREKEAEEERARDNIKAIDPGRLVKVREACREIGGNLSPLTVINMIKRGDVKGRKIAGAWYVDRSLFELR